MKYSDLQKKAKKLAEIWNKYQKKNWKELFESNKQKTLEQLKSLSQKKEEATTFYQEQKEKTKKTWDENKKKVEKVLPSEQELKKKRDNLLFLLTLKLEKIPINWIPKFGKYTGNFVYRFNRNRRNIALKQIKLAFPDWKKEKIAKVAEESFENIGETIFEILKKADYGKNIQNYVQVKNLEVAKAVKKTGAIIVTGHFANWEFGTFALEKTGLKGIIIGNEKSLLAKNIIKKYRQAIDWKTADAKGKRLGIQILQTIKNKETIYTMLDTDTDSKTLKCDFFEKKTNVSSFPARIAIKYQLPVISFFNYRTKNKKHIFCFDFLSTPPYNTEQTELKLSQIYTSAIEQHIRKYPSQWRWALSRWKKEI